MSPWIAATKSIPAVLLALALQAPARMAQASPGLSEQLHANAVASFRQKRFFGACGRFISLADADHAPAAKVALWMYQNGPSLFDQTGTATRNR